MKNKLLIAIGLIINGLATDAMAQEFSYGLKAGANLSSVVGNDVHCSEMKVRYQFGAFAEYRFTKIFAIETGVYYSKQGHYFEGKNDYVLDPDFHYHIVEDYKLDYLNIPLTFKAYANEKFSVGLSPQLGILLKNDSFDSQSRDEFYEESSTKSKDYLQELEFGIGVGANYFITDNIFAEVKYTLGLTNLSRGFKYEGKEFVYDSRNNVLALNFGYRF